MPAAHLTIRSIIVSVYAISVESDFKIMSGERTEMLHCNGWGELLGSVCPPHLLLSWGGRSDLYERRFF